MTAASAERTAWLAERRTGSGASDVAAICGLSKWASPYSCWLSKVTDVDEEWNDDMRFGHYVESAILDWFHDETGLWVRGAQRLVRHPEHPEHLATLDGLAYETAWQGDTAPVDEALGVVEAKSTTDASWDDGIPVYYRCQIQWQLYVTGLTHAFVPTLHRFSGKFKLYEVERDEADIAYIVARVTAWWNDHVLTGTPPPVDAHPATTAALVEQWPTPEGTLDADDTARELVARYRTAKATTKLAKETEQRIGNELRALLGDREALVDAGDVIASWKNQSAKRIDTDELRERFPHIADACTTFTHSRVLRLGTQGES